MDFNVNGLELTTPSRSFILKLFSNIGLDGSFKLYGNKAFNGDKEIQLWHLK